MGPHPTPMRDALRCRPGAKSPAWVLGSPREGQCPHRPVAGPAADEPCRGMRSSRAWAAVTHGGPRASATAGPGHGNPATRGSAPPGQAAETPHPLEAALQGTSGTRTAPGSSATTPCWCPTGYSPWGLLLPGPGTPGCSHPPLQLPPKRSRSCCRETRGTEPRPARHFHDLSRSDRPHPSPSRHPGSTLGPLIPSLPLGSSLKSSPEAAPPPSFSGLPPSSGAVAGTGTPPPPPPLCSTSLCSSSRRSPLAAAEHTAGRGSAVGPALPCPPPATRGRGQPSPLPTPGTETAFPALPGTGRTRLARERSPHTFGTPQRWDALPAPGTVPTGARTCRQQRLDQHRPPVHDPRAHTSSPRRAPLGPAAMPVLRHGGPAAGRKLRAAGRGGEGPSDRPPPGRASPPPPGPSRRPGLGLGSGPGTLAWARGVLLAEEAEQGPQSHRRPGAAPRCGLGLESPGRKGSL